MRFCGVLLLLALLIPGCRKEEKGGGKIEMATKGSGRESTALEGKRVAMIIAHEDFRDEELLVPQRWLSDKGAKISIASTELSEAKGMLGARVTPDLLIKDVNPADYDIIVFVGGVGVQQIWDRADLKALAQKADSLGKPIAAICLAPVILAKAGLLRGKQATVYESGSQHLISGGANYKPAGVLIDGRIITASGPAFAEDFAKEIEKVLAR